MFPFASLSNAFIQEPQPPFINLSETRLFHTTLRTLYHGAPLPTTMGSLRLRDQLGVTDGEGYRNLALAVDRLKARRWFGQPLYTTLHFAKGQGHVDFQFNPALTEHLLPKSNFGLLNIEDLERQGVTHAHAYRLAWVVRSFARVRGVVGTKRVLLDDVKRLVYGDDAPDITTGKLVQGLQRSAAILTQAGLPCAVKTFKRGNVVTALDFTLPAPAIARLPSPAKTPAPAPVVAPLAVAQKEALAAKVLAAAAPQPVDSRRLPHGTRASDPVDYSDEPLPVQVRTNTLKEKLALTRQTLTREGLRPAQIDKLFAQVQQRPYVYLTLISKLNRCIGDIRFPSEKFVVNDPVGYVYAECWQAMRIEAAKHDLAIREKNAWKPPQQQAA